MRGGCFRVLVIGPLFFVNQAPALAATPLLIGRRGGCGLLFLIFHILAALWVARDSRERNVPGRVVWIAVALIFGLLGLVVYLVARPKSG
ncbi:MAG TPA: PLDc N-terminal domain-containing protein [Acidobacteriota bacterium]|nr:PLDc N-terminal domain-containing protein [Acidobacteriota bacterium]